MAATEAVADAVADLRQRSEREMSILRAAYRVVARHGAHGLRVQAVAEEAGVSKGLVLYHFGSKSEVVQRAMQWALLRTASRVHEALARAAPGEVLADVVETIFLSPGSNREFLLAYLDLVAVAAHEPAYATLRVVLRDIAESLYESVVATAVERGELGAVDPAAGGRRMRVVVDGVLLSWLQQDDWRERHAEARELCLQMLRAQLAGPGAAAAGGEER